MTYLCIRKRNNNKRKSKIRTMKTLNFFRAAVVAAMSFAAVSCASTDDYTPSAGSSVCGGSSVAAAPAVQGPQLVITATIGQTKAVASAFKSSWTSSEKISVANAAAEATFYAASTGAFVEFVSKSSDANKFNNSVYAIYPMVSNLTAGSTISLAGQNGTLDNVNKYSIMTGKGSVSEAKANIAFDAKVAIICLHNITVDKQSDAVLKSVELTGKGISSSVKATLTSNGIQLAPESEGAVVVSSADFKNDVFVVFYPTAETKEVKVLVRDSKGGEFFTTVSNNGSAFQAGATYEVNESASFDGGYPINFNPTVNNWANVEC